MKKKTPPKVKRTRFVWCAEDAKYGLCEVFATKAAAEKTVGTDGQYWDSGYGGAIIKHRVQE